jgi:hypothetical protein
MNSMWSPDEPPGVSGLHLSDTGKSLFLYLIGWTPPGHANLIYYLIVTYYNNNNISQKKKEHT